MKKMMSKVLVGSGVLGAVVCAQGALIASEGFKATTTGGGTDYTTSVALNTAANSNVVSLGSSGFSGTTWVTGSGLLRPLTNSLTHNLLTGTAQSGSLGIQASSSNDRNTSRSLSSAPQVASSYFLSGLVNVPASGSLAVGDQRAMGFMDAIANNTFSSISGFHLGIRRDATSTYLTAYANSTAYNLLNLAGHYGTTYQVVLKLDVNSSGNETMTAWYAQNGATELTEAILNQNVGEIWNDVGDLDTFVAQTDSTGTTTLHLPFDEMRFGTTLGDVTVIPEPTTLGLFIISSCTVFFIRRIQH
jgi:hypothetical protein